MAKAAYTKKVEVSVNGTSNWLTVPATSPTLNFGNEVLDSTEVGTNAGYRERIPGIKDWSVNCDSNYDKSNAALIAIKTALLTQSDLHMRYLPDGTTNDGFKGKVVVESYNYSGGVGDLETVGITLQGDGALSAV